MTPPELTRDMALLLDLDGTLIDIAPTPDGVVVPPDLPPSLRRLRDALGDALAIITGRPIAQIDALLPGLPYAVAGEHGAALRHAPDAAIERGSFPPLPEAWLARARMVVGAHPGTLLERKPHGVALHFRRKPNAGPSLRALAEAVLPELPSHMLVEGAMTWEIRPRGVDKGGAVDALMARPPFAGRRPMFIGDDVTDEDAIRAVRAIGGLGLRVDEVFATPAGVRAWLAREAARL